ncbi:hypothetical protein ACFL3G_07430 [Planctomycetota bacterium]
MADSNYNIIKPVDNLHNVAGLNPIERRKERKRKQNSNQQSNKSGQQPGDEPIIEQLDGQQDQDDETKHTLDYRA